MLRPGTVHQLRSHHCLVQQNNYFLCHAVNNSPEWDLPFLQLHYLVDSYRLWAIMTLDLSYCTAVPPAILPFVFVCFWFPPLSLLFMALVFIKFHPHGSKACHKSRMATNSDVFLQNTYNLSQLVTQELYVCLFPSYNS